MKPILYFYSACFLLSIVVATRREISLRKAGVRKGGRLGVWPRALLLLPLSIAPLFLAEDWYPIPPGIWKVYSLGLVAYFVVGAMRPEHADERRRVVRLARNTPFLMLLVIIFLVAPAIGIMLLYAFK